MQNRPPRRRKLHRRALALLVFTPFIASLVAAQPVTTGAQSSPAAVPSPAKGVPNPKTAATPKSTVKTASASTTKAAPSTAQTSPTAESGVQEMAPILVTAPTRDTQPVDTTATTTTVLTHDDLDNQKFALLPDALQSVPGLAVVTSGAPGSQTSVFIHGLDSRQTLVTVDGRRQAVGFSGADDNLANLTLDNIDQIEVVRTPVSSAQGGSAMGGVINLVTLSGKGLAPEGSVFFEGGSFETFREGAQSRGQIGNFDFAVAGSRQDSIYPADSPGSDIGGFPSPGFPGEADQYRNTSFRGNMGYQITPDLYVDFHAAYSNAYTSSPGIFRFPDPTASLTIEDWNLSPEVVWKVNDFYTTKLYYIRDDQRLADNDPFLAQELVDFGDAPLGAQDREQLNTNSGDWQNDLQLARNWSITTGVQGDYRDFFTRDNNVGQTLIGDEGNVGGYISSQWQPIDGLNILNSGRYDDYTKFKGAFSWRQAATYRFATTQTLVHASVASAYTPPTIEDLYFSEPGSFDFIRANPKLTPESDLGCEGGVEQPFWDDRLTLSATYFHNDERGAIEDVLIPGTFGGEMPQNVNHVTTDGGEFGLKVQPLSSLVINGYYTYVDAVNNVSELRLVRRPHNTVNFTGTWKPLDPLTLTLGGTWIVGREDYDSITGVQRYAPDYFVLRASATYQINQYLSVWVRGENLTDRNYQPALGYFATSIAGYGGIRVSF